MRSFQVWLDEMSIQPLPGGVAAAAVAGVMGTALVSKAIRTTLQRKDLRNAERAAVEAALGAAQVQRAELMYLAEADEQAYRAMLDTCTLSDRDPVRIQAWQKATEVPLPVAEACHSLLRGVSTLLGVCWPAVRADLWVGGWLLETGVCAGLLAAECNVDAWGDGDEDRTFRARIEALREGKARLRFICDGLYPMVCDPVTKE